MTATPETDGNERTDAPEGDDMAKQESIVQTQPPTEIATRQARRRAERARKIATGGEPPAPPAQPERITDEEMREFLQTQQMAQMAQMQLGQAQERATKAAGACEYVMGRLLAKYGLESGGGIAQDGTIVRALQG